MAANTMGLFGYLLVHFVQSNDDAGEQIHFSLSEGDDPLRWRRLNGGQPVLVSRRGTGGVRDPHLVRSPDGGPFFLVATDLRAHDSGWDDAVRHGSRAIEVWQSDDLLHWGEQRHVVISPPTAGMTWAPESIWDEQAGNFLVHWTSSLYDTPEHTDKQFSKILASATRDFVDFGPARIWLDPAQDPELTDGVLDATVVRDGARYYRFVKGVVNGVVDEAGAPLGDIFVESAATLATPARQWKRIAVGITHRATHHHPYEGPLVFPANDGSGWYLWADHYGDDFHGYVPLFNPNIATDEWKRVDPARVSLPRNTKHGVVLPLRDGEWQRLHEFRDWNDND